MHLAQLSLALVRKLEENVNNYKKVSLDQVKAARERVKNLEYTQHLK